MPLGVKQVDFLRRTITPNGITPQPDKVKTSSQNFAIPSQKRRYRGILTFQTITEITYHAFRLSPFFKLLKKPPSSTYEQIW